MADRSPGDTPVAMPSLTAPATTLTVVALAAGVALVRGGGPGHPQAVAFAAGVCVAGGIAGWLVCLRPAVSASTRVAAVLGTVAVRILPALLGLAWLQKDGGELRTAGAGGLLVAFYLAALAADLIRTILESRGGGSGPGFRPPN